MRSRSSSVVRVAVLVDLYRETGAGGHVKAWERLAEAAADPAFHGAVDLTVHFLGDSARIEDLAAHVRYLHVRPTLSTRSLPSIRNGGGDTDLAPRHWQVQKRLHGFDVLHATDTFALGRSARQVARATGSGLAFSIHTDLPRFTEVYASEIIERTLPHAPLRNLLLTHARVPGRLATRAGAQVDRMIAAADRVLVSRRDDYERALRLHRPDRIGWLRRGIDMKAFHPALRDRSVLAERFGISPDKVVLLFVGRVDPTKQVMTAVAATRILLERDRPVHLLIAGEGAQRATIQRLLGRNATAPGFIAQTDLSLLCASADIMLFPSESETYGNVLNEAMAAGLPVAFSPRCSAVADRLRAGTDAVLVDGQDPRDWADAILPLVDDPLRRRAMAARARAALRTSVPGWQDVVGEDLLPIWQAIRDESHGRRRRHISPQLAGAHHRDTLIQ